MSVSYRLPSGLCRISRDVEHAADSFCVISCARIGHHFNILDEACRHHLEYHRRIAGNHRIRLPVHIDLKTAASVYSDIILSVNRHHRHFSEHVEHRACLGIDVILHLIGKFVHFHYDKGLLSGHRSGFKSLHIVLDKDFTKVKDRPAVNCEVYTLFFSSHVAEDKPVAALVCKFLCKPAVLTGGRICYRF